MAGTAGLEPTTYGFGDRCATNCATSLGELALSYTKTYDLAKPPNSYVSVGARFRVIPTVLRHLAECRLNKYKLLFYPLLHTVHAFS